MYFGITPIAGEIFLIYFSNLCIIIFSIIFKTAKQKENHSFETILFPLKHSKWKQTKPTMNWSTSVISKMAAWRRHHASLGNFGQWYGCSYVLQVTLIFPPNNLLGIFEYLDGISVNTWKNHKKPCKFWIILINLCENRLWLDRIVDKTICVKRTQTTENRFKWMKLTACATIMNKTLANYSGKKC